LTTRAHGTIITSDDPQLRAFAGKIRRAKTTRLGFTRLTHRLET
jgi:hypothetical protein